MGGLGNGRRGGRSPPLIIAALIACILVLGFNYWVSSSRNLELQTKVYELEGQVRRGVAERGAAESKKNEFQGEIQRQKEQISQIERFYKTQLEEAQSTWSEEKVVLQQNISSSSATIQELKGQLNQLNEDLGKLQKKLWSCQDNINTLNDKLTYDMTHCHSQVLSQKELCDERVVAAKLEVQKKMEKLIPPPSVLSQHKNNENGILEEDTTVKAVLDGIQTATVLSHTPSPSQPKEKEPPEMLTNDIIMSRGSDVSVGQPPNKDLSTLELQSAPSAVVKEDALQPKEGDVKTDDVKTDETETETSKHLMDNLTEDKEMEVMDTHEEDAQTEDVDPGMEGLLIGQGKMDDTPGQKVDEPEEYDVDEPVLGGIPQQENKQAEENVDKELEEELADYNGDDENEGEFEADKQAALAQI
ncbi:Golgi membrane protein 1 [Cololabis saira]|uniref:Golgi membrane protein 1 n=1 Tax=Cololabis saira TaxID=129043 RepID=UPI002AD37B61|nr:Golgi membrane protein 1 [Cololabis saira]XP_061585253.1 Golgi membrane protein 1 [Cololabis saira]